MSNELSPEVIRQYNHIRTTIRQSVAKWISLNTDEKKLRRKIYRYMDKNMKAIIPNMLGIEKSWNGAWRISENRHNNNFLWTEMQNKIQTLAKEYVHDALKDFNLSEDSEDSKALVNNLKQEARQEILRRTSWDMKSEISRKVQENIKERTEAIAADITKDLEALSIPELRELLEERN